MKSLAGTCSVITVLLLVLCLSKLDTMEKNERRGSGQVVRGGGCETERRVGESLESWGARHREAMREFREDQPGADK